MTRYSLGKEKRIHSNDQFVYVIRQGRCLRNKILIIYVAKNDCDFSRLGVSVGKVYGNAVKRNRFKRLVREVFRQNQYEIPNGYDYLVMPGKKAPPPVFEQIKDAFLNLTGLV